MSYSYSDFTDDILNALKVEVPEEEEYNDNPSAQADLAFAEIERLQKIEQAFNGDNDAKSVLILLRWARDIAKRMPAPRTVERIRKAIASADGAARHAKRAKRA